MEVKRLEQGERQFKKDRDDLLRTLLGVESGLADIRVDDEAGLSGLPSAEPKKRKKGGHYVEADSPMVGTPSASVGLPPPPPKRVQSAKSIAYGNQLSIYLKIVLNMGYRFDTLYHQSGRSTSHYDRYQSSASASLSSVFQITSAKGGRRSESFPFTD